MSLTLNIATDPIFPPFILIDHSNDIVQIPAGTSEGDIVTLILKFGFVKATDLAASLGLPISWNGMTRTVMIG
jgi:hypothetical protein